MEKTSAEVDPSAQNISTPTKSIENYIGKVTKPLQGVCQAIGILGWWVNFRTNFLHDDEVIFIRDCF